MPTPVTVRQLAALAGVSRTTVSLALNNHPRLLVSTRKRIQQLAAEHGYNRDPVIASLMARLRVSRKKRVIEKIAFLSYWPTRPGWRKHSATMRRFFTGARARAAELGYEIDDIWALEPGLSPARLSNILYTRAIRGLLLSPILDLGAQPVLDWKHFAAVTTGFSVITPTLHRVAHSHFIGMQLAQGELAKRGYRRIGFVTREDQDDRVNHGWLGAYLVMQRKLPPENQIPPLISPQLDPREFDQWLQVHAPDVVLSNLLEVAEMLAVFGPKISREIGFASLDVPPEDLRWAGIDQQHGNLGAVAADTLIKLIQNNEYGIPAKPVTVLVDGTWRDGSSLRSLPGTKGAAAV